MIGVNPLLVGNAIHFRKSMPMRAFPSIGWHHFVPRGEVYVPLPVLRVLENDLRDVAFLHTHVACCYSEIAVECVRSNKTACLRHSLIPKSCTPSLHRMSSQHEISQDDNHALDKCGHVPFVDFVRHRNRENA